MLALRIKTMSYLLLEEVTNIIVKSKVANAGVCESCNLSRRRDMRYVFKWSRAVVLKLREGRNV